MDTYEKKYNEALKRFKAFKEKYYIKDTNIGDAIYDKTGKMQKDFEDIFPELRESEDERIRKEIINYLDFAESHNLLRAADYEKKKGWLSYLEKQKDAFENGRQLGIMQEQARQELGWPDEKQKEQKPAEWSEEDKDILNCCISSIEEAKENRYAYKETDGDTSYDREIDWLKSLRPSWKPSEEQMIALNKVVNGEVLLTTQHKSLESLYEQLKKL